ncbi:hypothetical protein N7491_010241 [Penicillium cf. griseofulvum]|uniref:Uncharacterized protein n=1 Tax=Penicillium cf. griseofulvum TaxID=2972120 RepID=A0A9W9MZG8_9EURO|nr:hypothetical protein N7472_000573 [Penicillium cf. griseofulvum]KAJ5421796.1 hypothetical protein N7491_010241 [Penicillium cf. griseofulvum]
MQNWFGAVTKVEERCSDKSQREVEKLTCACDVGGGWTELGDRHVDPIKELSWPRHNVAA